MRLGLSTRVLGCIGGTPNSKEENEIWPLRGMGYVKRVGWEGIGFQALSCTLWLECKVFVGDARDIHLLSAFFTVGPHNSCVDHNSNTVFQKPNIGPSLTPTVIHADYKWLIPRGCRCQGQFKGTLSRPYSIAHGLGLGPPLAPCWVSCSVHSLHTMTHQKSLVMSSTLLGLGP